VRLVQRTTRKLALTEIGEAYYERCSRIVAHGPHSAGGSHGDRSVALGAPAPRAAVGRTAVATRDRRMREPAQAVAYLHNTTIELRNNS
jgi:hypothetical protein